MDQMRLVLRSEIMRIRIGIIMAYLLLGCILLEDALPYFAKSNTMELCECKTESEEKESKKLFEDDWKEVKDKYNAASFQAFTVLIHPGSLTADSEEIPDSAHQSIFSPPPNRV